MKQWTDIREWIAEEDALIAKGYDSITVYTGEEGTGKSYAMLARQKLADPSFHKAGEWSKGWRPTLPTDRVVFEEEDAMRLALSLQPGQAFQLDEADAHRRGANTRARKKFLKFLKERRSLRLRWAVGYPHINQVDRDILRSRVRYRAHQAVRGVLEVKSRVVVREEHDRQGNPIPVIRWPVRGRFAIPDISGFSIVADYDPKKEAFTHRDDDLAALHQDLEGPRHIDTEAGLPAVAKIREALQLPAAATLAPNQEFYSQVLGDITRAP